MLPFGPSVKDPRVTGPAGILVKDPSLNCRFWIKGFKMGVQLVVPKQPSVVPENNTTALAGADAKATAAAANPKIPIIFKIRSS